MGKPNRPQTSITYEQAVAYESSRVKWYDVYGHITNIKELADEVFHIPHITVFRRLKSGWPLEAAFLADTETQWNYKTISWFQSQPSTKAKFELMVKSHFNPNNTKSRKGQIGVTLKDVIDGGTY